MSSPEDEVVVCNIRRKRCDTRIKLSTVSIYVNVINNPTKRKYSTPFSDSKLVYSASRAKVGIFV